MLAHTNGEELQVIHDEINRHADLMLLLDSTISQVGGSDLREVLANTHQVLRGHKTGGSEFCPAWESVLSPLPYDYFYDTAIFHRDNNIYLLGMDETENFLLTQIRYHLVDIPQGGAIRQKVIFPGTRNVQEITNSIFNPADVMDLVCTQFFSSSWPVFIVPHTDTYVLVTINLTDSKFCVLPTQGTRPAVLYGEGKRRKAFEWCFWEETLYMVTQPGCVWRLAPKELMWECLPTKGGVGSGPRSLQYGSICYEGSLYVFSPQPLEISRISVLDLKTFEWKALATTGDINFGPRDPRYFKLYKDKVIFIGASSDCAMKVLDLKTLVWSTQPTVGRPNRFFRAPTFTIIEDTIVGHIGTSEDVKVLGEVSPSGQMTTLGASAGLGRKNVLIAASLVPPPPLPYANPSPHISAMQGIYPDASIVCQGVGQPIHRALFCKIPGLGILFTVDPQQKEFFLTYSPEGMRVFVEFVYGNTCTRALITHSHEAVKIAHELGDPEIKKGIVHVLVLKASPLDLVKLLVVLFSLGHSKENMDLTLTVQAQVFLHREHILKNPEFLKPFLAHPRFKKVLFTLLSANLFLPIEFHHTGQQK